MKNLIVTVNGVAYNVTVEDANGSAAPVAASPAAPAPAPAAPAAASRYSEMPTARVTGFKPLRPRAEAPAAPLRHTPTAAVAGGLTVGRTVVHQRFGRGVVEQLEGVGADAKATVVFDSFGRKTLLLRFATLEVVD